MLRLALAGNMLRAIGGTQALYDKCFIPAYPDEIFYDKVKMKLGPADRRTLGSLVEVIDHSRCIISSDLTCSHRSSGPTSPRLKPLVFVRL